MDAVSREPDPQARFAALLARLERGEVVDWELEVRGDAALAVLHDGWRRAEGAFAQLGDSAQRAAEWRAAQQELAGPGLERLCARLVSPQRQRERYETLEVLGRGGMGLVTRVRDHDLGRELALKTVLDERPRARARFVREVRIVARLEHPSILPVHDLGLDAEGRLYFTMPLVRGRTLERLLEERPPDWTRARFVELAMRVGEALAYAHARGIVHRDVKPANVLIGPYGEVYLTDWGLAALAGEAEPAQADQAAASATPGAAARALADAALAPGATAHGAVLGTPPYMAPEQARGELARVGPRADVFALGAVLYHALGGARPHAGAEDEALLAAARRGRVQPLEQLAPDLPEELAAIVARAMASEPGQRYRDAGELAADLRAFLEGRVVRAHARGAWVELRKWFGRNRRVALFGALALLGTLGGLSAVLWTRARAEREITRLADARRLEELELRAAELWPAVPAREPELARWIEEALELRANRARHEAALERLRGRAVRSGQGTGFEFDDPADQWVHDTLAALVLELQRWERDEPRASLFADVRERLEFARTLRARSLESQAQRWRVAGEEVRISPRYGGLELAPQLGLVPLGLDRHSGLAEFAHLASGTPPERDADGDLVLSAASGIVLVLVPGGETWLGSIAPGEAEGPERAQADLLAELDETPRVRCALAPYFLAKHELTRAQAARLAREPSGERALEPCDTLAWDEARALLERAALLLPSEAQWEHAARAGSSARFAFGAEVNELFGRVNAGWASDGRALHAGDLPGPVAVDSLEADSWGFHHLAGNVAEWTLDAYAPRLDGPRRAPDGLRFAPEAGLRATRGGHFASEPRDLRCAARQPRPSRAREATLGVRAARAVDP